MPLISEYIQLLTWECLLQFCTKSCCCYLLPITIAIRNHHINCLVRTNSAKHAYTSILYLTCKVAFIPLTLNKKKRMEVNYSKLTPINHRTVGMNRILYAVWGIASKKKLVLVQSRDVKHNCYCSSDTNISDLNYDFLSPNETYRIRTFCLIFFYSNSKKITKEKRHRPWVSDDVSKVAVINYW